MEEEILEQEETRVLEETEIHERRGLQGVAEARVQVSPSLENQGEEAELQEEAAEGGLMYCDVAQEGEVSEQQLLEENLEAEVVAPHHHHLPEEEEGVRLRPLVTAICCSD